MVSCLFLAILYVVSFPFVAPGSRKKDVQTFINAALNFLTQVSNFFIFRRTSVLLVFLQCFPEE